MIKVEILQALKEMSEKPEKITKKLYNCEELFNFGERGGAINEILMDMKNFLIKFGQESG